MITDSDEPCCVWCNGPIGHSVLARRRRHGRGAPDLCLKCTLWAMVGQKPPYVVSDLVAYEAITAASKEWPGASYPRAR